MKTIKLVTLFIVSLSFAVVIGCGSNAPVGGDDIAPCDGGTDTATSGSDSADPCSLSGATCSPLEGQINACGKIFTCCKDAAGALKWQDRIGCGTSPATDTGSDTGSIPADTGVAPADTGTPPVDTGTDTGAVTDTGPSPPFDGGLTTLIAWLDPAKYPGCSTVVWDNMGVELRSEVEKPLVVATDSGWKGYAFSMAKCSGVYKMLAPVGSNAETAGYKQLTLWGMDMLKKAAICSKPYGTADKLAIPIDKGDLTCP